MLAIEFGLKISSMYSIRVPYSYQCARTYPLPAPSTIKGLCANALWRKEGNDPLEHINVIQEATLGATSRAERPIAVSSCTVSTVDLAKKEGKKTDARLRQFAFTPYINCMMTLKSENEALGNRISSALKTSPVYLGDSESLVSVIPDSINLVSQIEDINEGQEVKVNSTFKYDFIKDKNVNKNGLVLYMQDNPLDNDAVLERYIAPLTQEGDIYRPLDSFSFVSARNGIIIKGNRIDGIFSEDKQTESTAQKPKRGRKKKAHDIKIKT